MKLPPIFLKEIKKRLENIIETDEIVSDFIAQIVNIEPLKISDSNCEVNLNYHISIDETLNILSKNISLDNIKKAILYGLFVFKKSKIKFKKVNDELIIYISCSEIEFIADGLLNPIYGKNTYIKKLLSEEELILLENRYIDKIEEIKKYEENIIFEDEIINFDTFDTKNIEKTEIVQKIKKEKKLIISVPKINKNNTIEIDINNWLNINYNTNEQNLDKISKYYKKDITKLNNIFYFGTNIYERISLNSEKNKIKVKEILNNKTLRDLHSPYKLN